MIGDLDYLEDVTLPDGTAVTLRAVRPEDKELFARGMRRLSSRSRMRRFMFARGELTPAELTYLTEIDGVNHVAIGALVDGAGVAVARFVRLDGEPETAEPAITIVDDLQGRGLGRILLIRLVAAARSRRVTRFRAEILGDNREMLGLLRKLAPTAIVEPIDHEVVVVEVPLPDEPAAAGKGLLAQLLSLVAQGLLAFLPPRRPSHKRDETSQHRTLPEHPT